MSFAALLTQFECFHELSYLHFSNALYGVSIMQHTYNRCDLIGPIGKMIVAKNIGFVWTLRRSQMSCHKQTSVDAF